MQRSGTIPASQLPTVELLLYQLQARQYGNLVRNPSFDDSMAPQGLSAAQQDAQRMLQQDRTGGDARLEDLQEYIVRVVCCTGCCSRACCVFLCVWCGFCMDVCVS